MNPDKYYQLVLAITGSEAEARKAQAQLMFNQMAPVQ